jgi:hypothetical protein
MTSSPLHFQVPATLRQRMDAALSAVNAQPDDPDGLGAAALECLRDALARPDERSAAVHLLAADALITRACEVAATANDDGAALLALCDNFDAHRIRSLLDS